MSEQEEALRRFAKELAEYTANGRIGTQLTQYIEEILRNKLKSTESVGVIIDIMAFISISVTYVISNLNLEKLNQNSIEKFSTVYGEETLVVLQTMEGWTENMSKYYGEVVESYGKIYGNTLGNTYLLRWTIIKGYGKNSLSL